MKVLGIAGSLRRESYNSALLRAAAAVLPDDVDFVEFDGLRDVPPYDQDLDLDGAVAPGAAALREAIGDADAVLFATPEYNGSVPGVLKNAVDWASRPRGEAALLNKPVAVIGASTGMFGALWAQADLRKALGIAGARVIGEDLPVGQVGQLITPGGRLLDADLSEQLALHVGALVDAAREREPVAA